METAMQPALLVMLALAAPSNGDEIGLLRFDSAGAKEPLKFYAHPLVATGADLIGQPTESDLKMGKQGGKKPVRFTCGADIDGDGQDEVVLVTSRSGKPGQPLDLKIYKAPASLFGNLGAPLATAKKGELGNFEGDKRVVCIGAVDVDGDKRDELAVVKQSLSGFQFIEIRKLPAPQGKSLGPVIASDFTFGQASVDETIAVFGLDLEPDGTGELGVIRRGVTGNERLLMFEPPPTLFGETGDPVRSDGTINAADGATVLLASPLHTAGPALPQFVLLRRDAAGALRLDVHGVPAAVNGEIGPAIASDSTLGVVDPALEPVLSAFTLAHDVPLPWEPFNGPIKVSIRIGYKDSAGNIVFEWVGPFSGPIGVAGVGQSIAITFPGSTLGDEVMPGLVQSWTAGSIVFFNSSGIAAQDFVADHDQSVVKKGDRIVATYPKGKLVTVDGRFAIDGDLGGTPIGEVQGSPTILHASISAYRFESDH